MACHFKYRPGHVVWCRFPREDDPTIEDDRPALILEALEINGRPFYKACKLTKTNNSHRFLGRWILERSAAGRSMHLDYDTFIHLQRIELLAEAFIRKLKGQCPQALFNELQKLLKGQ